MKNMQKGFTLIELMIVVAIIAILAAIAIPAYQDYLVRSQVSEGATLTDGAKTAVAEYYANHGSFPPTNLSAGLAPDTSIAGKYVSAVDAGATKPGVIIATFSGPSASAKIQGLKFGLSAVDNSGSINWSCTNTTYTTVAVKYLPSSCRK
jgi:type IV pilus assembly protein PilA